MRDYPNILVAFLEDFKEGHTFEQWPHHITVVPWFKANAEAVASLKEISERHLPIETQIGETAMFGVRNDILVRVVESEELRQLHQTLLSQHDGLLGVGSSSFTGENYRPHITLSGKHDPSPGATTVNRLSLVESTGDSRVKRIGMHFGS